MFNPWFILVVVIAFAVTNASSYIYGGNVRQAQVEAKAKKDQDEAIAKFNLQAAADTKQAAAAAAREAAARTRAAMTRSAANEAIRSKPLPLVCDWEPKSFGVLIAAVKEANGTDAAAGAGVPDAVLKSNRSGKPER